MLLKKEISYMAKYFNQKKPTSVYFGGGTPSLLKPQEIDDLLSHIHNVGFDLSQVNEITLEADPKTMISPKEEFYLLKKAGVNRISLGVQTCNDKLLALIGREHRSVDIQAMIEALHQQDLNFSMDLLFGLPHQSRYDLQKDLEAFLNYAPSHISTYLLEVSAKNELNAHRPSEQTQAQMLEDIEEQLKTNGFDRYELSNYAKPDFQSQHNLLYWNDHSYLGFGLAAHSYLKPPYLTSKWGVRFWNPRSMPKYKTWVEDLTTHKSFDQIKKNHEREDLLLHQSLTDFCHTQLRKIKGFAQETLVLKYGKDVGCMVWDRLKNLKQKELLEFQGLKEDVQIRLSKQGKLWSNKVFQELTFLPEDTQAFLK